MALRRTLPRIGFLAGGVASLYLANRLVRRPYSLRGRTVLITGGSRGLGLLLAREVVRQGAKVVICGRNQEALDRAADDLRRSGGQVHAVVCDVTVREDVQRLIQEVLGHWGKIDVLINNAGIIQAGPVQVMTIDDFRSAMDTHYWGPLYTILETLPSMRRNGGGRIVNIASIGGKISVPHLLPYSASKFALVGLSEGLRSELAQEGILVTTVCPGLMRTGSPRNALFKGQHRSEYAWFSVSDSIPGASMSAERAARQIIRACCHGRAEIVLSLPAVAAARVHGVAPGLVARALGWVNRMLPRAGGIGHRSARGFESESRLSPSVLTRLSESAAVRNNEVL
ncbi:MAG TPA: SDR family NAD(P)-dependent oxidoreductase [Pirellulales bacterium]|nr:SDR family NAD(P)-dependent oxidoreductase [Pirellulales bacterium]